MSDLSKRELRGVKLEGKMWRIYSLMLLKGCQLRPNEGLPPYMSDEIKFDLIRLEKLGLINKKPDGAYELIEDKKLDVLLPYLLEEAKKATLRHIFYLGFVISSLLIFLFYLKFLPQGPSTTISVSLWFVLFSLFAFMVEVVYSSSHMSFIQKLLEAR